VFSNVTIFQHLSGFGAIHRLSLPPFLPSPTHPFGGAPVAAGKLRASPLEELGDRRAGAGLEVGVQAEEAPVEAGGEEAADGGLTCSHEAGEDAAAEVGGDERWRVVPLGFGLGIGQGIGLGLGFALGLGFGLGGRLASPCCWFLRNWIR
jgi:hypothetical protein